MTIPAVVGLVLEYRKPELTRLAVEALLGDGCSGVVVWDNSDDQGASLRVLQQAFALESRVRLLPSQSNLGFAGGVQQGMQAIVRQDPAAWILLVNNDARILPGAVGALRSALLQQPEAVLAFPRVRHAGRTTGPLYYHRRLALVLFQAAPGAFAYPSGSVLLIAPERLSGPLLDEEFFMYGEDVELGWRLRRPGAMVHVPLLLAEHLGSQGSGGGSLLYETWLVRSHWMLARKLALSRGDRTLNLLGRALSLPLRAALRALRYRSLTPLLGFVQGSRSAWHR